MEEALTALASRVLGGHATKFSFLQDGGLPPHTFELRHEGARVNVRGSDGPALGAGLSWYLSRCAGAHVSWHGSHLGRVAELPALPGPVVRRTAWAEHRYFLNYCCFSYSLAFWRWEQWEFLIDWMALHGVNMPLSVTGQEAVWQNVGRALGLSGKDLEEFLPGPAYLPFGWMGCLDGWTGPLPSRWIPEHEDLGRRILNRQRELGMRPVLQGFSGHVPPAVVRLFPEASVQKIRWLEWETYLLDPLDPLFSKVAALFLEEQKRLFGTNHLYAVDPFIEMVPPSGEPEYLARLARAIWSGIATSDPEATWILQGWPFHFQKAFWTAPRLKAFLDAVPQDRLLLLDLYCESHPMWRETDAFHGKPWIWCNVQSFGQNVVLTGALEVNGRGLEEARRDPLAKNLCGIGMVNEGLCQNPAAYDFLFERPWENDGENPAAWGRMFAARRYGRDLASTSEAWAVLAETVYARARIEDSGLVRCPTIPVQLLPEKEVVATNRAWFLLLEASEELSAEETYCFDLLHVGRQVLSNLGNRWKADLQNAIAAQDGETFAKLAGRIRELLGDFAMLLACHPAFCVEPWIASAVRWGETEEERARLRQGALRQLTLWGDGRAEELRDYARKEWSGLVAEFYRPRWERWFAFVREAWADGRSPDPGVYRSQMIAWEREWILTADPRDLPRQETVAASRHLWNKYRADLR
jgi:alpha-N-acetylglucosaminidase